MSSFEQVRRWADDPLSVVNLGGRKEMMSKVITMTVEEAGDLQFRSGGKALKVRPFVTSFRCY